MRRTLALIGVILILCGGCSGKRDPRELIAPNGAGTIFVDARLIVGERFPTIRVATTQSPDLPYFRFDAALLGAEVTVFSSSGDSVQYSLPNARGDYRPYSYAGADTIAPRTTYYLRVVAPDGRVVTAQTTTPDPFHVREWDLLDATTLAERRALMPAPENSPWTPSSFIPDSVFRANQLVYQDGIVEARFDRGNALAFQMALFNLEDNSPLVIDADFLSEADKASLDRESSSPPIDAPDGYARLPWLAVWYEGRHRFVLYSVDRNWYDIARSVRFNGPSNLGFGSNAGDDFERPIFHVDGGIGLFGSAAMDQTGFIILPRP
jgi:hypothetical protein